MGSEGVMACEIKGLSNLLYACKDVASNYSSIQTQTLEETANAIISEARPVTPVDTGRLKSDYHVSEMTSNTITVVTDPTDDRGRNYAAAQEYGWHDRGGRFHQGRFFMDHGVKTGGSKVEEILLDKVRDKL